jgi:methyl-accepting chemotaxis protein
LTESRFFLEDQAAYLKAIENKYPTQAKEIKSRGTSVGIQPVESLTAKQALSGKAGFEVVRDYRGVDVFSAFTPVKVGKQTMALLAEIDVEEALRPAVELRESLVSSTVGISIALLVVSVLIALWLTNTLVRPLTRLGKVCDSLSTGNGDLTIQLKADNIPEINRIVTGFNIFIAQIRDIVAQIKVNADTLASASEELSMITKSTGEKTTLQRDQTHMVATAMQQLSAAVDDVSKSTVRTSDRSVGAQKSLKENMERANMAAQNIKLLVKLIDDSSKVIASLKNEVNQITSVLNVITSIADQTNLLALNAAIEAARAGEAGRGFSVVADEVRALAIRSQESTVEISKLVEVMNQSAAKSVHSMERATAAADGGIHLVDLVTVAMDELALNLRQVLELTESVASATEEQNQTSHAVVKSVQQISDLSSDVESGSQQIKQAAQSLAETAAHTHALVERFKVYSEIKQKKPLIPEY